VRLSPRHSRPRKRDALRSPSPGRRLPPPTKRQRGNPRPPIAVPDGAADGHTNAGAHKPDGGSGELPWIFPRYAERRVELSRGDSQSIRGRGAFTQRIVDGVFFWFLSRSVTARSRGGFRVLSSMTADAFVGAAAGTSWGVRLGGKAIKDGMILSGGLSVMPVRTGRVWWGVVVRDLDKVLPLLVKYMRGEIDSPRVPASSEGTVTVIDTSGVGKGDGGWNDRVLNGLFKMLARTVVQTYSINANELGHTENNLRSMLPMRVVAPRRSFAYETADNLLAYVAALVGAPDDAARGALPDADSSDWRKAPYPADFRHLLRHLLVAHHPTHAELDEEQQAEAIMSRRATRESSSVDNGGSSCRDHRMGDRRDSNDDDDGSPGDRRATEGGRRSSRCGRSGGSSGAGAASSRPGSDDGSRSEGDGSDKGRGSPAGSPRRPHEAAVDCGESCGGGRVADSESCGNDERVRGGRRRAQDGRDGRRVGQGGGVGESVVVQAVGEVYKVTSLAALVVFLAVLVEDQMVAQVAVRGVATKLGLHNTMERWGLGLRVTIKVGTKVKAQTPVVLVLTVGNFSQHQDPRGSDRRHQDEIGGNDERPRGGRRRSDGGRDGARVGQGGGAVGARGGAGGGRGARGDELGGARRGSGGARPGPGAPSLSDDHRPRAKRTSEPTWHELARADLHCTCMKIEHRKRENNICAGFGLKRSCPSDIE